MVPIFRQSINQVLLPTELVIPAIKKTDVDALEKGLMEDYESEDDLNKAIKEAMVSAETEKDKGGEKAQQTGVQTAQDAKSEKPLAGYKASNKNADDNLAKLRASTSVFFIASSNSPILSTFSFILYKISQISNIIIICVLRRF